MQASGLWSVESHALRPQAHRQRACDVLRACYELIWQHESSSGSACSGEWRIVDDALLDVWIGHVIPAVLAAESGSDFLDTYGAMPVAVE